MHYFIIWITKLRLYVDIMICILNVGSMQNSNSFCSHYEKSCLALKRGLWTMSYKALFNSASHLVSNCTLLVGINFRFSYIFILKFSNCRFNDLLHWTIAQIHIQFEIEDRLIEGQLFIWCKLSKTRILENKEN